MAVSRWRALDDIERDGLLAAMAEQIVVPRPLQFFVGELSVDNDAAVEIIEGCRGKAVGDWPLESLILVTTLWLWQTSKIAISELNQADLSFSLLEEFLTAKRRGYLALLGRSGDEPPGRQPASARRVNEPSRESGRIVIARASGESGRAARRAERRRAQRRRWRSRERARRRAAVPGAEGAPWETSAEASLSCHG